MSVEGGVGWGGGGGRKGQDRGQRKGQGRGKGGGEGGCKGLGPVPREEPALESLNAAVHLHLCAQRGRRPEFLLAWKFTRGIGVICRGKWGLS